MSAYERGVKSPTLKVAARIIAATGHDLNLRVHIDWVEHHPPGIVRFWAPNILWSVGPPDCFATLTIPDFIRNTGMRDWDMRDREERKGVYEQLIRRGLPQQMIRWMDGALLVDVWDELDLPDPVRASVGAGHPDATEPLQARTRCGSSSRRTRRSPRPRGSAATNRCPPPPPPPPPQRRSRFDPRPLPQRRQSPRPGAATRAPAAGR